MEEPWAFTIVTWLYAVLGLFLVANRLYVRAARRANVLDPSRPSSWSDVLMAIAWVFICAQTGLATYLVSRGALRRIHDFDFMTEEGRTAYDLYQKVLYIEGTLYFIPLYCVNGAILSFYLEITPEGSGKELVRIRRAIWTGIVLNGAGSVGTIFATIYYPRTLGFKVREHDAPSTGSDQAPMVGLVIGSTSFHMFMDLYIYAIPCFILRKLPLNSRSQRLAAATMFAAGALLVCAATVQMMAWIPRMRDPYMWAFWGGIHEHLVAVSLACMPALRVTIRRWWRGPVGSGGRERRLSTAQNLRRGELSTREVVESSTDLEIAATPVSRTASAQTDDIEKYRHGG